MHIGGFQIRVGKMLLFRRNRVEKLVSSYGLDGGEIVADIASDYFEDYVNYKEPELDITNDEFIAILQKI